MLGLLAGIDETLSHLLPCFHLPGPGVQAAAHTAPDPGFPSPSSWRKMCRSMREYHRPGTPDMSQHVRHCFLDPAHPTFGHPRYIPALMRVRIRNGCSLLENKKRHGDFLRIYHNHPHIRTTLYTFHTFSSHMTQTTLPNSPDGEWRTI